MQATSLKWISLVILGVLGLLVFGLLWRSLGSGGQLIFLLVLALGGVWLLLKFNELRRAYIAAKLAESNLDAALKGRFESLPRLEEYLQSFTNLSKEVLKGLAEARKGYGVARTIQEKWDSYNRLAGALNVIVENYPDLRPQQQAHTQLMQELSKMTGNIDILQARKGYNQAVWTYNLKCSELPTNIAAAILGFRPLVPIQALEEEREMPASRIRLG